MFAQISSSPLLSLSVTRLSSPMVFACFPPSPASLPFFPISFSCLLFVSFSHSLAFLLSSLTELLSFSLSLSLSPLLFIFLSCHSFSFSSYFNIHFSQFYTSSFPSPLLFISLFTLPHFFCLSCFSLAIVFRSLPLLFLSCLYPSPLFSSLSLTCHSFLFPSLLLFLSVSLCLLFLTCLYPTSLFFFSLTSLFYCFLLSCSLLNLFHLFVSLSLFLILFLFPSHLFLCHMTIFSLIFLSLQTQAFPFNSDVFFFIPHFHFPFHFDCLLILGQNEIALCKPIGLHFSVLPLFADFCQPTINACCLYDSWQNG